MKIYLPEIGWNWDVLLSLLVDEVELYPGGGVDRQLQHTQGTSPHLNTSALDFRSTATNPD
jgi:hypothetical protein